MFPQKFQVDRWICDDDFLHCRLPEDRGSARGTRGLKNGSPNVALGPFTSKSLGFMVVFTPPTLIIIYNNRFWHAPIFHKRNDDGKLMTLMIYLSKSVIFHTMSTSNFDLNNKSFTMVIGAMSTSTCGGSDCVWLHRPRQGWDVLKGCEQPQTNQRSLLTHLHVSICFENKLDNFFGTKARATNTANLSEFVLARNNNWCHRNNWSRHNLPINNHSNSSFVISADHDILNS